VARKTSSLDRNDKEEEKEKTRPRKEAFLKRLIKSFKTTQTNVLDLYAFNKYEEMEEAKYEFSFCPSPKRKKNSEIHFDPSKIIKESYESIKSFGSSTICL
jgi:hypothetical protein